jgi:hypothetical protein
MLDNDLQAQSKRFPNYHEIKNNCYDYICRFLNNINYAGITWTKENLALTLIEPKVMNLDRYCDIVKKVLKDGVIIEDSVPIQYTYSCCDICGSMIVVGKRFRCTECQDFDLCKECFDAKGHKHKMINL